MDFGPSAANEDAASKLPPRFVELIKSRQAWIESVLAPWCEAASYLELQLAESQWLDLAGRPDPEQTLWRWAWRRFPGLVHPELGIDESRAVDVTLSDGSVRRGFPDARASRRGSLVLVGRDAADQRLKTLGPWTLAEIQNVSIADGD